MKIRQSHHQDEQGIKEAHKYAFGKKEGPIIADLVSELLRDETAKPILSLVFQENDNTLLGHILFTKVTIYTSPPNFSAQILAPLAVIPSAMGKGLARKLINKGLQLLKDQGTDLVFVLGDPNFYSKFGFRPAKTYNLIPPYPLPDEYQDAWMLQELTKDAARKCEGIVQCSKSLNNPDHWA